MSHSVKLWGRVVEARLRREVSSSERQYGLVLETNTTDEMFGLNVLTEFHCVFVDIRRESI